MPNSPARLECYALIKRFMGSSIAEYYRAHPERFGDERSKAAIVESMKGCEGVINILNDYVISYKKSDKA